MCHCCPIKGGIKINVGPDHDGYLPSFIHVGAAREHEIANAREFEFPAGSILVSDRGFIDYVFFNSLISKGNYFVTRMKKNTAFEPGGFREVDRDTGVIFDQDIVLTGGGARKCGHTLRMVGYADAETGKKYTFLTNAFHVDAKTVADIYKGRWQIDLCFKRIKQNLKMKSFLGTSRTPNRRQTVSSRL